MSIKYKFKARVPRRKLKPQAFIKRWSEAVAIQTRKFERDMRLVTNHFSKLNQPGYSHEITRGGNVVPGTTPGDLVGILWIKGDVFSYLELGTPTPRYVAMTPNFRALTVPGRLGVQSRSGGPLRYYPPGKPGIQAREWRLASLIKQQPRFVALVNRKTAKAISEAWK